MKTETTFGEFDGESAAAAEPGAASGGLLDGVQEQFGSAPWWVVSAIVHTILVLLTMLFVVSIMERPPNQTLVLAPAEQPLKPEIRSEKRTIAPNKVEVEYPEIVEHPLFPREETEDVTIKTDNNVKDNSSAGESDAITDVPHCGEGVDAIVGLQGLPAGCRGFRSRGGNKDAMLRRFGGTHASESAVNAALRWLANHQEADGSWSISNYEGSFPETGKPAVTGLALLAFLGAGHTDTVGRYKKTVHRAINWLISQQRTNGAIGENNGPGSGWQIGGGYNHMIAGLALAEAYGMSKNSRTQRAAQKAVDYTCNVHQSPGSGWRYKPGMAADISVTGWAAMQLKSARIAGLRVPDSSFAGARSCVDSGSGGAGGEYGGRVAAYQSGKSPNPMTASMGAVCRIFLGEPKGSPDLEASANMMANELPAWGADVGDTGGCQFYYWYYGTMAMFQLGGSWWKTWNAPMRDMLVENQRRGGDADGSWDPVGARDGRRGGRVYTTAMGALCLEVYYRYLPVYKDEK